MSDLRYILGDIESTGLSPDAGVCELAYVELDEGINVVESVHSLIDPQMPISAGASGIHGLTYADVADAPTMEEFFTIVKPNAMAGNVVFMAHNVNYDVRYFGPWIPNLVATLCTLRLARRVFPEVENHKLPTLMYALGLTRGTSHRADGDVTTTLDLLRKISDRSGLRLGEMIEMCAEPIRVEEMTFGKHKGMRLRDLPRAYVTWLLDPKRSIDSDLKWSLETM